MDGVPRNVILRLVGQPPLDQGVRGVGPGFNLIEGQMPDAGGVGDVQDVNHSFMCHTGFGADDDGIMWAELGVCFDEPRPKGGQVAARRRIEGLV